MFIALLKTMRIKQWPKNGLIFAALVFDRQLLVPSAFLHALSGFFLFCLLSSAVYIINDVLDIDADRNHPAKRLRPIPSGKLPLPVARRAVAVILLVVLPLAYLLSRDFAFFVLGYFLLSLAYSVTG